MIDLRTCVKGQKLRSRHGATLEYLGNTPSDVFPHAVKFLDGPFKGGFGTRTNDGFVFSNPRARRPEDEDIIEIIS